MAKSVDDAVFDDVQVMLDRTKRLIQSEDFKTFLDQNKKRMLHKYALAPGAYTSEKIQSFMVSSLNEAFGAVRGLGFYMTLSSANKTMITRPSLEIGAATIVRESNRIVAELASKIPPDGIVRSDYLRGLFAGTVYQYVLFVTTSAVDIDDKNIETAIEIRDKVLVKLLVAEIVSSGASSSPKVSALIGQLRAPYFIYGSASDYSDRPSAIWSDDFQVHEYGAPGEEEGTDYMVLALGQELRWSTIMSALDIIRDGVQFEVRADSDGKQFQYEGSGYDEDSDRNFILLFMTYKALSLPMGKYLDILAESMAQSLKNSGAKPVIVGMLDRANKVLNRQDLQGGSKNYSQIKRQILSPSKESSEYENAGWYMAEGMVAELAQKTREPKPLVSRGDEDPHKEGTPFPRLFATYNSKTYTEYNYSASELTKLSTTWGLLGDDPIKGVKIPSPVADDSGAEDTDEEAVVGGGGADVSGEPSVVGGIDIFFDECVEKLMGEK